MDIFEVLVMMSLIMIAFGVAKLSLRPKRKITARDLQHIRKHWKKILEIKKSHPSKAILDADKLLHFAFTKRGVHGSTGAQLKAGERYLSNLQNTWNAHKLRNRIAHELIEIKDGQVSTALRHFKKAINDLTNAKI